MFKVFSSISFFALLLVTSTVLAQDQDIKYVAPPSTENEQAVASFSNIVSSSSSYVTLKIGIKNKTNGFLYLNNRKIKFQSESAGSVYPTSGGVLIYPNSKQTSYCKAKVGENTDQFSIHINNLRYAPMVNDFIEADALPVEANSTLSVGHFDLEIIRYNNKNKKSNIATLQVTYNGPSGKLGLVDFKSIAIEGQTLKTGKFRTPLTKGQKTKAIITIRSKDEGLAFDLSKVFKELTFESVSLDQVNIKKEGFVAKFNPVHAVNGKYKVFDEGSNKARKVVFFNTENEGFKISCEGVDRTPFYTTNATLGIDAGLNEIQVFMDGIPTPVISTKIDYHHEEKFAKYKIQKDENGVYSMTYVEGSVLYMEDAATAADVKANNQTSGNCELSFADFSDLKSSIQSEANSGGKPAALAGELLQSKQCISTAQIIELMPAFNLDNNRLEFAKKAYKYTSDKNKYFQIVSKLSYNKNKEALENFISAQ